jgi:hypothetical protein
VTAQLTKTENQKFEKQVPVPAEINPSSTVLPGTFTAEFKDLLSGVLRHINTG